MWCLEKKEKREIGDGWEDEWGCNGDEEGEVVKCEEFEFMVDEEEVSDGQRIWERHSASRMSVQTSIGRMAKRPAVSTCEGRVS